MSLWNSKISGSEYTYKGLLVWLVRMKNKKVTQIFNNKSVIKFIMGHNDTLRGYQNFDVDI